MKLLKAVDSILEKMSDLSAWVSGAALFTIAALTFVDVFCRYFLRSSITGTQEIVQFAMVFVVYFSLPYSTRIRAHVRVDALTSIMGERIRFIVLGIVTIACVFVSVNISIQTFKNAGTIIASGTVSPILKVGYAPFYYVISIMNILLSMEFIADGIKYFKQAAGVSPEKEDDISQNNRKGEKI